MQPQVWLQISKPWRGIVGSLNLPTHDFTVYLVMFCCNIFIIHIQMADDLELWKSSASMSEAHPISSLWLFDPNNNAIFISKSAKNTTKIQLSRHSLLDCVLLDLHNSYWSTNPRNTPLAWQLKSYHSHLRFLVEKDLIHQHHNHPDNVQTPTLMKSWVQRTLCLYGHHEDGRRTYEESNLPDLSDHESEGYLLLSGFLTNHYVKLPLIS